MAGWQEPIRRMLGGPSQTAADAGPSRPRTAPAMPHEHRSPEVEVHHLWSDAPNALKFQVDRTLLPPGQRREYRSAQEASGAPLARALLETEGARSVVLESVFITVELDENGDWEETMKLMPQKIRKFFAAGGTPVTSGEPAAAEKKYKFGFRQVNGRPREEQLKIVQQLFDEEVNPAVASHGGSFTLLDIQDNNVYVQLGGGCQGCGMANVTLRQGVEARLREVLPEMDSLIDTTDHASGTNPYHQQSKK